MRRPHLWLCTPTQFRTTWIRRVVSTIVIGDLSAASPPGGLLLPRSDRLRATPVWVGGRHNGSVRSKEYILHRLNPKACCGNGTDSPNEKPIHPDAKASLRHVRYRPHFLSVVNLKQTSQDYMGLGALSPYSISVVRSSTPYAIAPV